MAKKKTAFVLAMPSTVALVAGMRAGVRPGQVFRDKRRRSRVNERADLRRRVREEA